MSTPQRNSPARKAALQRRRLAQMQRDGWHGARHERRKLLSVRGLLGLDKWIETAKRLRIGKTPR